MKPLFGVLARGGAGVLCRMKAGEEGEGRGECREEKVRKGRRGSRTGDEGRRERGE